jgi:hypothetical protein
MLINGVDWRLYFEPRRPRRPQRKNDNHEAHNKYFLRGLRGLRGSIFGVVTNSAKSGPTATFMKDPYD